MESPWVEGGAETLIGEAAQCATSSGSSTKSEVVRERLDLILATTALRFEASVDFTITFDSPNEEDWIVARVLEVPGAMSQGRTREEARENVLDALRTVLTPNDELAGETPESDHEHLRFTAAA
jgi:predicted RNase H-like HicB family nuclease